MHNQVLDDLGDLGDFDMDMVVLAGLVVYVVDLAAYVEDTACVDFAALVLL